MSLAAYSGWVEKVSPRGTRYRAPERAVYRLPDEVLECVLYLYQDQERAAKNERRGGSGFLVSIPSQTALGDVEHHYIVTAKHIINQGFACARLNTLADKPDLIDCPHQSWEQHPTADIAACPIDLNPEAHEFKTVPLR